MKILLISDNDYKNHPGGAERNDECLQSLLNCDFVQTKDFANQEYDFYILSNHYDISEAAKEFLSSRRFIFQSHDYIFCNCRNPANYYNLTVPHEYQRNREFLLSAKEIIVHSKLQWEIWRRNGFETLNWSGNLWSNNKLDLMESLSRRGKNGRACVLASENPIKGQVAAEEFCRQARVNYDLLPPMPHKDLLKAMSRYSMLVTLPASPETYSRVVAEAKMMNLGVISNEFLGLSYNEEYSLSGTDFVEKMREKKKELVQLIKSYV